MAYNSDGYIMLDFTEVDFRRTNQTIDGLFKRCVDVIGTNKFILVINANGRTPLPATCSFTNNQYVIDTVIYMFAVSSNDNLFIRRNDVPASDIIDDSSISVDKTWSSNKIDSELDTKADISALADYQPLLTPASPISISEDDVISVDLSSKQDVLTPGNNISIVNNVISSNQIKSFSYTGLGTNTNTITIPDDLTIVIGIAEDNDVSQAELSSNLIRNNTIFVQVQASSNSGGTYTNLSNRVRWTANQLQFISNNNSPKSAFNVLDEKYTVYYI